MANKDNLRPIKDSELARELQAKSVIARKKNDKDRKNIRLAIEALLEREYKGKDGKKISGAEAISLKQMEKALKGDTKAFEVLRDSAGQKPVERVMVAEVEQSVIDEVEAAILDDEE